MSVAEQQATLVEQILEWKARRNAVILAHSYQRPEVQDIADFVGDSLGLSRQAALTGADVIVFCGVHFMAETAKILSPSKKVLLPDLDAGCSLAATITADQLRAWKARHPDAVVVSYVNTSAEVKAETDYCCTSSNAVQVVRAIPPDREILFCPDMFLGQYVKRVTGRTNMRIWAGECHVHAGIRPEHIQAQRAAHPGAEFLMHPECGCVSSLLYMKETAGCCGMDDAKILSTEGMVRHAQKSPSREFVVATETGILHRLRKMNPDKAFFPVSERAVCKFMKLITLEKVLRSLQEDVYEIDVPPEIAARARLAIQRMIEIG
ncbi:MAG: quinolinate synthase NadA [Kiritimatiellae bacterium]|nr:quinolinate synthase NadA [Kiritimatiellia bacterium]MDW8458234.1 quinolinate synthase NadA [Verrucomicrobiota bacterium]